jgi:hypothetical protein
VTLVKRNGQQGTRARPTLRYAQKIKVGNAYVILLKRMAYYKCVTGCKHMRIYHFPASNCSSETPLCHRCTGPRPVITIFYVVWRILSDCPTTSTVQCVIDQPPLIAPLAILYTTTSTYLYCTKSRWHNKRALWRDLVWYFKPLSPSWET